MLMFCVIINAFTATFDQFNTFLLKKNVSTWPQSFE